MPTLPFIFQIVALILSLFILGKSADFLVTAVTRVGFNLKLSRFITGFLLLGVATSTPEMLIAINSSLAGIPQLSLGNLLGANIVLLTLIAGGTAVLARGVTLKSGFNKPFQLALVAVLIFSPIIVLLDSHLSRLDSLFLAALYSGYLSYIYRLNSTDSPPLEKQLMNHQLLHSLLLSVIGLLGVIISSKAVVSVSLSLAPFLGLPPVAIGLLVLSVGTNLPELSVAFAAVKKHESSLVLGDILGSAATNTGIVALLGLLSPFDINFGATYHISSLFLIASLLLFTALTRSKNRLSSLEGVFLLAVYIAYLTSEIVAGRLRF